MFHLSQSRYVPAGGALVSLLSWELIMASAETTPFRPRSQKAAQRVSLRVTESQSRIQRRQNKAFGPTAESNKH